MYTICQNPQVTSVSTAEQLILKLFSPPPLSLSPSLMYYTPPLLSPILSLSPSPPSLSLFQTLMQWKTKDVGNHSFNNTTFSMTCGSESITMVTKQGHMISAYLSGMKRQQQQQPAPPSGKGGPLKKPLRPQRSATAVVGERPRRFERLVGEDHLNSHQERRTTGGEVRRSAGQVPPEPRLSGTTPGPTPATQTRPSQSHSERSNPLHQAPCPRDNHGSVRSITC